MLSEGSGGSTEPALSARDLPPIRSWLYAPGNNAKLLDRVFGGGADAVILDLEDAVPSGPEKLRAREMVAETIRARAGQVGGPRLWVRVNEPMSGLIEADIRAVAQPGLDGLRLPKMESVRAVRAVHRWLANAEIERGLTLGSIPLVCTVESAAGVWCAADLIEAHPRVVGLAFGAADFVRDIGVRVESEDGLETLYARSRLVLASRVAGVQPPIDSVYTQLSDDQGLERTTRQGRALGFFGRSAIHPRQVPIINNVYTPTSEEVARAREVVEAAQLAGDRGSGAIQLANGDFVDVAVVRRAQDVLRIADLLERGDNDPKAGGAV